MTAIGEASGSAEWQFGSLAYVWDVGTKAIMAGADRLESLPDLDRTQSIAELSQQVGAFTRGLDDSWLVATALFMIDDLYKSSFYEFRWSTWVDNYIAATAGTFLQELAGRGYVLHYVVDNTQPEGRMAETLAHTSAVFASAGLIVAGPQLMALELMDTADHQPRDLAALARYRDEGHFVANTLIERCHLERRHSAYLNLDLDDDSPALSLDAALSQAGAPDTIVVFRNQPPRIGSIAQIAPPPGLSLPTLGA